ncbi:ComEC/Rec2-related protein [Bradyrhizobium barranii subsp. barranii]
MTAVVLIAVMVDRRAITFRTLAVAALIVLAVAPEALVHPSFQMSFAATLGLVALVQIGMPNLFASPDHSATARIAMWGGREIAMLFLASLIAGLATTPYAAFHFHRVTPFGVLANLGAMPVVSALVMPAGLLGLIAAPFGLDGPFWWLMGIGIDWMVAVSRWVAALPGAVGRISAFGIAPLIAASLGIIVMGLLRTPLRWAGAVVLLAAIPWGLCARQPDVLIAGDGQSVAPATHQVEQGQFSSEGMARRRRRSARCRQCLTGRRRVVRRSRLRDAARRRAPGRAGLAHRFTG